jgi:two-component system, NarL family, sensor histidine kinase DesK
MSGPGQRGDLAPRFAWTFAAAFLCLVLPARLAFAVYWAGPAGVALATATFVLPLLYTLPRGRTVWARHRGWLLAAQAVLTYLPFAVFGPDWIVPLSGLLGGLLLLTVGAPASWILFAAVLAVEGVLRIGVLPLPVAVPLVDRLWVTVWLIFTVPVNTALALFGLVRLGDLVTDLHATQTGLAALAAIQQRLRSASRLREAIGDRLETITARAKAALPLLARSPELARSELTEAAGVARQALDQVRVVAADDDRDPSPPDTGRAGDTVAMAPRLARLVLLVVLCVYMAHLLLNLVASGTAATAMAGAAAAITTVVALQLYHSLARRGRRGREGARPRGWAWTLAAQTLLSLASFLVFDELTLLPLAGFSAGSVLLLLPGRWAWAAFVAILASVGTLTAAYSPYGLYDVVNLGAATAAYGLMVYGLSRLTDLAHQVEATRRELARMAVVQERLRVARDTHDLLGLSLSAVALKCDLVVRLIGRDDTRARGELEQLLALAAKARGDVLSVTGEAHRHLSLRAELTAARDTLAAAGVAVRAGVPAAPVPPAVDAVLATVLREAITNVLRHATAKRCTIRLSTTGKVIRLQVTNDGVRAAEPPEVTSTGGAGIGNLRARVRALGGHLNAGPDGDGRFELVVEIPVTP